MTASTELSSGSRFLQVALVGVPIATAMPPVLYYSGTVVYDRSSGAIFLRRGGAPPLLTPAWQTFVAAGGGGQNTRFVFTPGAPQNGNVYGDFAEMESAIAALPPGELPEVVFTESFTLPSAGMPAGGWSMALGSWRSVIGATGAITVTIPDGVSVRNLAAITNGLGVMASPTTEYGVFQYSSGIPWILSVGLGAKLVNTGSAAAIITPGDGTTVVFALNDATNVIMPSNTAAIVKGHANGTDSILGGQFQCGPFGALQDGWVEGKGTLTYLNGIDANPLPVIAGWTGSAPTVLSGVSMRNIPDRNAALLPYTAASAAAWNGNAPADTAAAFDRIAALVGPIP